MAEARSDDQPTKLVCFELHGQEHAVDIAFVKESLTERPITKVALTPSWLSGIVNLRGDVVAVVDLSLLLGIGPYRPGPDARLVIASYQGKRLGMLCDRLCDLRSLPLSTLQEPPSTLPDEASKLLQGSLCLDDGHIVRVLDIKALFESKQLASFRRGASS